jgi:hypothetical protein
MPLLIRIVVTAIALIIWILESKVNRRTGRPGSGNWRSATHHHGFCESLSAGLLFGSKSAVDREFRDNRFVGNLSLGQMDFRSYAPAIPRFGDCARSAADHAIARVPSCSA